MINWLKEAISLSDRKLVSPLLPSKKAALNALFCAFLLMNGVSILSGSSQLVSVEIGCCLEP